MGGSARVEVQHPPLPRDAWAAVRRVSVTLRARIPVGVISPRGRVEEACPWRPEPSPRLRGVQAHNAPRSPQDVITSGYSSWERIAWPTPRDAATSRVGRRVRVLPLQRTREYAVSCPTPRAHFTSGHVGVRSLGCLEFLELPPHDGELKLRGRNPSELRTSPGRFPNSSTSAHLGAGRRWMVQGGRFSPRAVGEIARSFEGAKGDE